MSGVTGQDYLVRSGQQIMLKMSYNSTTSGGFNQPRMDTVVNTSSLCDDDDPGPCFTTSTSATQTYFIVKLLAVDGQKTFFEFAPQNSVIYLGDVVGLVGVTGLNTSQQFWTATGDAYPVLSPFGWSAGSDNDDMSVYIFTDGTNMGYYVTARTGPFATCCGTSNCGTNPGCGLQPATNIPLLLGQSYAMQNFGLMVDTTTGGNNYSQIYIDSSPGQLKSVNDQAHCPGSIYPADQRPSEHLRNGEMISVYSAQGYSYNDPDNVPTDYWTQFSINPTALSPSQDKQDRNGLPIWVYLLLAAIAILLITIGSIMIYVEGKRK